MAKQDKKRANADITAIYQELQQYPDHASDMNQDAWEMLTDAQKLVYLAKQQLKQVKGSQQDNDQ